MMRRRRLLAHHCASRYPARRGERHPQLVRGTRDKVRFAIDRNSTPGQAGAWWRRQRCTATDRLAKRDPPGSRAASGSKGSGADAPQSKNAI